MYTTTGCFILDLAPRTTVPLDAARGHVVHVKLGMVWITEEHETGDHMLRAGQAYQVRQGGRVVVEALSLARIGVEAPVPLVTARRLFAGLARRLRSIRRSVGLGWSA